MGHKVLELMAILSDILNLYIIIITPQGRKFFLLCGKVCFSGKCRSVLPYYTK